MERRTFGRIALWLAIVTLTTAAALTAPDAAAGDRFVVRVPEPFEVNGTVHPAGKLSLEPVRALSPIATLHEVRIDGQSHGLVLVRAHDGGSEVATSEIGFVRSADGHLVLESVALAGRHAGTVYSYRSDLGQWLVTSAVPRPVAVAANH
jgi:hypothetical protein